MFFLKISFDVKIRRKSAKINDLRINIFFQIMEHCVELFIAKGESAVGIAFGICTPITMMNIV